MILFIDSKLFFLKRHVNLKKTLRILILKQPLLYWSKGEALVKQQIQKFKRNHDAAWPS